jgi:predicted HTH domain antitoxin
MQITINIPDELAAEMASGRADFSRTVLEALALEGYRSEQLSEAAIRRLLGFETRMEVHGFLKEHGVYLHYGAEDLEHDLKAASRMKEKRKQALSQRERLAG